MRSLETSNPTVMSSRENSTEPSGPLRAKIEAWSEKHTSEYPDEIIKLFADKSEEVLKSGILANTPQVGQEISDFELESSRFEKIRLSDQLKTGPVILNFYRGSWCHFCTLEFQSLLETLPRFRSHGSSVLAISPQVVDTNEVPEEARADFINLKDLGNRVARQFGLVYPLGEQIRKVYQDFGVRLELLNGNHSYEVPVPASYLIDRNMTVRYSFASADLSERAEPEMLLREISRL